MTKRLAIVFLSAVLAMETVFPQGHLADLAQLPEMFAHFETHRQESPDITIIEFLTLHYGNSNHLASSSHNHHKLPFSKRTHRAAVFFLTLPEQTSIEIPGATSLLMVISGVVYRKLCVPSVTVSIWQPPRI